MVIEMMLLALIAAAVFAYVLAPIVRPARVSDPDDEPEDITVEQREPVASEGQPVRDTP